MFLDVVQLKRQPAFDKATFLGVGPMSENCVNATIELANELQIPIILIASRRQIDSAPFGGGYVNNWTTEEFCNYVKSRDKRGFVLLARDHGGPWQSDLEVNENMNLHEAMDSAKESYRADIAAGMNIIHVDPGRSPTGAANASINEFIERTKELIVFCYSEAERQGKKILIEIGTDEGVVGAASIGETEAILEAILDFCREEKLPQPSFMVVQTGTKVMELRNVGALDDIIQNKDSMVNHSDLSYLIKLCRKNNVLLKEHNADYLSNATLAWHAEIGIDSANIAPEFGVLETKAFLKFLLGHNLQGLHDRMLELAFNSGKWKKWMLEHTNATDYERSVIAGHYIFATKEFIEIKQEAKLKAEQSGFDLDSYLIAAVKSGIFRCLDHFGMTTSRRTIVRQELAGIV